jgi:peptidoglycan-associated lipoprotein
MNNVLKLFTLVTAFAVTACSSTGASNEEAVTEEVNNVAAPTEVQLSDVEREALATTVFYFEFDSSDVNATDRAKLVYHAVRLQGSTDLTVRLEGHASEEGTREYNLALGERRANAVAMFLMANGVARSQIEVVSYGEEQPVDVSSTDEARSKNRRVEIK